MRISLLIKLEIKCFSISCFHFQKQNPNYIVGPCPPTCTLLKVGGGGGGGGGRGGQDLPKIESVGGNEFFCEKGGINLKRGSLCKNGELPLFLLLYISVQSHLLFWIFSLLSYPCKNIHVLIKVSKSCTKTQCHLYISDPFQYSTKNADCFI